MELKVKKEKFILEMNEQELYSISKLLWKSVNPRILRFNAEDRLFVNDFADLIINNIEE